MAKFKINVESPEFRGVVFFLICLSGVLIFVFLGISPNKKNLAGLEKKIKDMEFKLDVQKTLMPIYKLLQEEARRAEKRQLPFLEKSPLPREQTDKIFADFRKAASEAKTSALSIMPDLNSLSDDTEHLLVFAVFSGSYNNIRDLLINLVSIPYLEHIESIEIQETRNAKNIRMNIWVSLV